VRAHFPFPWLEFSGLGRDAIVTVTGAQLALHGCADPTLQPNLEYRICVLERGGQSVLVADTVACRPGLCVQVPNSLRTIVEATVNRCAAEV